MGGRSMAWWRWGNFKLEFTVAPNGCWEVGADAEKCHCRGHYSYTDSVSTCVQACAMRPCAVERAVQHRKAASPPGHVALHGQVAVHALLVERCRLALPPQPLPQLPHPHPSQALRAAS